MHSSRCSIGLRAIYRIYGLYGTHKWLWLLYRGDLLGFKTHKRWLGLMALYCLSIYGHLRSYIWVAMIVKYIYIFIANTLYFTRNLFQCDVCYHAMWHSKLPKIRLNVHVTPFIQLLTLHMSLNCLVFLF